MAPKLPIEYGEFSFEGINFFSLLSSFDQGVLITNAEGVLVFYNEVQGKIDSLNPDDVIGKKITEVYDYNNDSSTCMRVLQHGRPIINYALSYQSQNANVGNTIHSVFPLYSDRKLIGTICFVKDYNILERCIPEFLLPKPIHNYAEGTNFSFASLIGAAPEFIRAVKTAKMAANSSSPVMLFGETGTGKELFAQAIHNFHYNNNSHFVALNCAAIPENLLEGMLFGTTKGAYTGAVDKPGLFEKANGGTILLDEINSLPLGLQGKLLRVIQEKEVRRVGGLRTINLDLQIISSSNIDLRDATRNGDFRIDLFYRLAVILISIPPLRERKFDIEELARHFLLKYNGKLNKKVTYISKEVMDLFWEYPWPGNVREMEHVVESAMNMVGGNEDTIKLKHINLHFSDTYSAQPFKGTNLHPDEPLCVLPEQNAESYYSPSPRAMIHDSPERTMNNVRLNQASVIKNALEQSGGNASKAAKSLGISRQLMHYRMKKYSVKLP